MRLPAQHTRELGESRRTVDVGAPHQRGLAHVAPRHRQTKGRRGVGQGDHSRHVTQRAVQPELAAEGQAFGAGGGDLARRDEEPDPR